MSMHDVYLLANLLRSSGDRVLNGESKLRLTPSLLHKLNTCFSQIATQDTGSDFHVIPAHGSQLTQLSELDFLHDFVQKTPGLTVSGVTIDNGSPKERQTPLRRFSRNFGDGSILDLSRFRQLHHLEIRGGNIGSVAGVSALRGHIRTLMLVRVGEKDYSDEDLLRTVLAGCMHFSTDAHKDAWWPALTQLVACYCRLQTVGPCLSLAPRLVVLDLSHNALGDESALSSQLGVLLNLRYLNLSFNRLTRIPELRSELQYLVISHNHINYVDQVENLTGLLELNLVMNHLSDHSQLKELRKITSLHRLFLSGNPMCFHADHRIRTCAHLPKHAAQVKFLLDGTPFSKREKEVVLNRQDDFVPVHGPETTTMFVPLQSSLLDSQQSLTQSFSQGSIEQRRSRKVKSVLITNAEDIPVADDEVDKKTAEKAVVVGTPKTDRSLAPLHSSTPKGPLTSPLPEISEAAQMMEERLLKMAPVRPAPPPPLSVRAITKKKYVPLAESPTKDSSAPNDAAAPTPARVFDDSTYETADESATAKLGPNESQYETADESTIVQDSSTTSEPKEPVTDTFTRSLSIESEDEPPDSDNEDSELRTYVSQLVLEDSSDPQEVFMTVSSRYIKELETDSLKVRERWPLAALSECSSSEENKLTLTFKFRNSVKGNSRDYIMEDKSALKEVLGRLRKIIEARNESGLNELKVMHCMQCQLVFTQELRGGNALAISAIPNDPLKAITRCPACNSNVLVETEEKVLVEDTSAKTSKVRKTSKVDPPESTGNSLQHSASDSSIGSCVSLGSCAEPNILTSSDSIGNPPAFPRRCESDIDIISNPSQSSIEVLEDSNRSTPGRKRSSEERQIVAVPSLLPVPESNPPLAGLTESSSSGSMTDSVCTTYENGVASTANRRPASGNKLLVNNVLQEEPSRESSPMSKETAADPFNALLNGLLEAVDNKGLETPKNVKTDLSKEQIFYDFDNLACVDHRLKLHLYLSLLEEMDELLFILRSEIYVWNNSSHYEGFLVVSNGKVYLLKVSGTEVSDRIDSWLSRTHAIDRSEIRFVTPIPWMSGVHLQLRDNTDIILMLRDDNRTRTLLKFCKEAGLPVEEDIREDNTIAASSAISTVYKQVEGDSQIDMHHIELTVHVCSMEVINKEGEKGNKWNGGALHVGADVIIITDDSVWSLLKFGSDRRLEPFKLRHTQFTSNLMKVRTNRCRLSLEFVDEAMGHQETWTVLAKTENVVANIIYSLRLVWEPTFSVPLHVIEEQDGR